MPNRPSGNPELRHQHKEKQRHGDEELSGVTSDEREANEKHEAEESKRKSATREK